MPPPWTIVVDFDGTITEDDMLDAMSTAHAPEESAAAAAALLRGDIDLNECIRREFVTIRADHDEIVAEFVDLAVVRDGFERFVRAAQAAGHRVVVISSGFEALIRPVLERSGLGDLEVIAHDVRFTPDGTTVTFREEIRCDVCGEHCKRPLVAALAPAEQIAYVGDGWSDRCASLYASRRFARASLARYLGREGAEFVSFESFDEVGASLLG